jgi:hypothetical protein
VLEKAARKSVLTLLAKTSVAACEHAGGFIARRDISLGSLFPASMALFHQSCRQQGGGYANSRHLADAHSDGG